MGSHLQTLCQNALIATLALSLLSGGCEENSYSARLKNAGASNLDAWYLDRDSASANSSFATSSYSSTASLQSSAEESDANFVQDDLRDFTVNTSNLQICVWDYSCEDGDRVTVRVDSGARRLTLFSNFKLANAKSCRPLNLASMSRANIGSGFSVKVTLRADNGTGGEGNCPNNVNTGAISVSGGGGEDNWSLRGGTGSTGSVTYYP